MHPSLLYPPAHLSSAVALDLSQQAPTLLKTTPSSISPYSLASLFSAADSAELWTIYENLMMSCLRTGDEQSAHLCLQHLTQRFGVDDPRIMALRGLFQEAIAEDDAALEKILKEYDSILKQDPTNMPVLKRRIALLKSLKRISEAITSLTQLLDSSPTDAESWAELSDMYISQGLYPQAIFALEEVLLVTPYAWNIHARLGELLFVAVDGHDSASLRYLTESLRRFCRSIELCDDYLRGYYGLKLCSARLLENTAQTPRVSKAEGLAMPDVSTIERLHHLATSKLAEIVRRHSTREEGWLGYDEGEILSAQELLNRDSVSITR